MVGAALHECVSKFMQRMERMERKGNDWRVKKIVGGG